MQRSTVVSTRSTSLAIVLAGVASTGSTAQSVFWETDRQNLFTFEITKPEFDGDDGASFGTSGSFLGLEIAGTDAVFVFDLPFAIFGAQGFSSESAIGNPFAGVRLFPGNGSWSVTLGGRIPVAPSDNLAPVAGLYGDVLRSSAWLSDVLPVMATFAFSYRNATSGFVAHFSGSPEVWISTGEGSDSEFLATYSAQLGFASDRVAVSGGFGGLLAISTDGDFGERTLHQLTAAIRLTSGNVRPGVHLRLPLDGDLNDFIDYSIGFNLSVVMPRD